MQLGDGRAEPADLLKLLGRFSRAHQVFDMNALAREAGTVVSAVMLGAIAGSGLFPFRREDYEAVVQAGGKSARGEPARIRQGVRAGRPGPHAGDYLAQVLRPAGAPHRRRRRRPRRPIRSRARARDVRAGLRPSRGLPGHGVRRALRRPAAAGARRGARGRPAGRARLRHHAGGGALARAVDGLRRHRARRRPQEPRLALRPGAARGQARRPRPAEGLRSLQAGRAGIRRAAARSAGGQGSRPGTAGAWRAARPPGRCP
jgi:hypothetical protein